MAEATGGPSGHRVSTTLLSAIIAIFTALVTVATVVISVYFPPTRGYFNLGETMIYFTALAFGPLVGAVAGGIGSMLADIILGFIGFAPGTLLIKAAEGYAAGYLARRSFKLKENTARIFSSVVIALYFLIILLVGLRILGVELEIAVYQAGTIPSSFPPFVWVALAVVGTLTPAYFSMRKKENYAWIVLSLLLAGLVMVTGYFLYELLFLPEIAALAEIPLNIGQVVIGTAIAIPLYKAVRARRIIAAQT